MTDKLKKHSRCTLGDVSLPSYRIEADVRAGRLRLAVIGIIGVKEFSCERISLITKKEGIVICGKELEMSVFENRTVEITGEVSDISFFVRKRGERRI